MTTPIKPGEKLTLSKEALDILRAQDMAMALRDYRYDPNTDTLSSVKMGERRITNGGYNATPADDISVDKWRMRALAMRLRIHEGMKMPFQHIHTVWTGEKVFVFVVQKGEAVTLTDDSGLFPSDTLITQLRLIQE